MPRPVRSHGRRSRWQLAPTCWAPWEGLHHGKGSAFNPPCPGGGLGRCPQNQSLTEGKRLAAQTPDVRSPWPGSLGMTGHVPRADCTRGEKVSGSGASHQRCGRGARCDGRGVPWPGCGTTEVCGMGQRRPGEPGAGIVPRPGLPSAMLRNCLQHQGGSGDTGRGMRCSPVPLPHGRVFPVGSQPPAPCFQTSPRNQSPPHSDTWRPSGQWLVPHDHS